METLTTLLENNQVAKSFLNFTNLEQDSQNDYMVGAIQATNALSEIIFKLTLEVDRLKTN